MSKPSHLFKTGRKKTGGRQKGTPNRVTLEVREMARLLVEDPTYQQALRRRLIRGRAGEMEKLVWAYAYGKPVDAPDGALVDPAGRGLKIDLGKMLELALVNATERRRNQSTSLILATNGELGPRDPRPPRVIEARDGPPP